MRSRWRSTPQWIRSGLVVVLLVFSIRAGHAADWPSYKHDKNRSGITSERLSFPLSLKWTHRSAKPVPAWNDFLREASNLDFAYSHDTVRAVACDFDWVLQPVVAGGSVFFGSSADDTVRALDLANGKVRWQFTTGGPIRFAPAIDENRAYVASDDGFLYCLDAQTGKLIWKFRAAPDSDQLIGSRRMISRWPLRSGALVEKGIVYVTAGMWPSEGIFVYALDAVTGKEIWCNDTSGTLNARHHASYAITGVAPQGYLVATKDRLIVPCGRSVPAKFDINTGKLTYFKHTGYQHRNGGVWVTVNEANGLMSYGYPRPRLRGRLTRDPSYYILEHRIFQRKYIADRLLIADKTVYLVSKGNIMARSADGRGSIAWQSKFAGGRALAMAMAGERLIIGGDGGVAAYEVAKGTLIWSAGIDDGEVRGLAVADGRLLVATTSGAIHCFGPGGGRSTVVESSRHEGGVVDTGLPGLEASVVDIARRLKATKGYALVVGFDDARMAEALAAKTDLKLLALFTEESVMRRERERLVESGDLYGRRIAMQTIASLDSLPYASHFCNLAVVGTRLGEAGLSELYRALRPFGGVALFVSDGKGGVIDTAVAAGVPRREILAGGKVIRIVRGKLSGVFDWDSKETVDERVKWPLELLWFTGPELTRAVQGGPISRPANGRFFVVGQHAITAVDAYNGTELWVRDIPYLHRTVAALPRMPGPKNPGMLESLAADESSVYVKFGKVCYRLDAYTGVQTGVFGEFPKAERVSLDRPFSFDLKFQTLKDKWGKILVAAPVGETLEEIADPVGMLDEPTGAKAGGSVTVRKTATGIQVELATPARPARQDYWEVFFDFRPRARRADLYGRGIFHVTVSPSEGAWNPGLGPVHPKIECERSDSGRKVLLSLSNVEMKKLSGMHEITEFAFAAAYNQQMGKEVARWYKFADIRAYAFNNGWPILVLSGDAMKTENGGEPVVGELSDLPEYALRWGRVPPHTTSAPAPSRPEYHAGDAIRSADEFKKDGPYGNVPTTRTHPLLLRETDRVFMRGKGCGGRISSGTMEFLRCATLAYYDFDDDSGVRYFGGVRTGCYVSMVPALGLLFSIEASNMCRCTYNYKSSLALIPTTRRRNEDWATFFDVTTGISFVNGVSLNLGAPGDRRDEDGTLWLQHPRAPRVATVKVPFKVRGEGLETYRINADRNRISGTDRPWIYASGYKGLRHAKLDLVIGEGDGSGQIAMECARPPVIDGKLKDRCWDGYNPRRHRSRATMLRYDKENFYIAFRQNTIIDKRGGVVPWRKKTKGRDAPVWEDSSAAVFLRDLSERDDPKCLHLGISASGAIFDGLWNDKIANVKQGGPKLADLGDDGDLDLGFGDEFGEQLDKTLLYDGAAAWNGKWSGSARTTAKAFTAEFAIPWKTITGAGLRRDTLMIRVAWRGQLVGELDEIVNDVFFSEDYSQLVYPDLKPELRPYTVRLHFSELDDVQKGDRVFGVKLQGKSVLQNFDIIAAAGGRRKAIVREFKGVMADRDLSFELIPSPGKRPPIISGFELLAER